MRWSGPDSLCPAAYEWCVIRYCACGNSLAEIGMFGSVEMPAELCLSGSSTK